MDMRDKVAVFTGASLADQTPALAPADIANAVRFNLEQPDRANLARLLLVSSSESV